MAGALLLLAVQLASAAHFHNPGPIRHSIQAASATDAEQCSLCAVAFHAPIATTYQRGQLTPTIEISAFLPTSRAEISRIDSDSNPGRAPPA